MTYDALSTEQKDILQTWINLQRSWAGEQARVNNHGAAIDTMYNAQVSGILAVLDDNEVIPNTSGLSGASSLDVDAECVSIQSHIQGIATSYDTAGHRQLWAKAAGANNLIG